MLGSRPPQTLSNLPDNRPSSKWNDCMNESSRPKIIHTNRTWPQLFTHPIAVAAVQATTRFVPSFSALFGCLTHARSRSSIDTLQQALCIRRAEGR
jgi:hypothetical protein